MTTCIWKNAQFLLLCTYIALPCLTLSQPEFLTQFCEINTTNTAYKANLKTLLSTLAPNTDGYGFYSSSFGQSPNTAHAMALCRGDTELNTCRACINNAMIMLPRKCPRSKEAFGWYDECMVRYSNKSIIRTLEVLPPYFIWNTRNTTNGEQLGAAVMRLLDNLRGQATGGGWRRKFATGSQSLLDYTSIYGLVQCTPDLTKEDCDQCLSYATNDIFTCCGGVMTGKQGRRVYKPSCNLGFETYKFFNDSRIYNDLSQGSRKNLSNRQITVGITVASAAGFVISLTFCVFLFVRKRKQRKLKQKAFTPSSLDLSDMESLQYNFGTISAATDDYSNSNKLGQGGFGSVYKGKLLNGQEIAVKRLAQNSGQGDQEFKNEVMLVAKLSHRNLVKLLGFCLEGAERLLIYEFVPNSSLDQFIFDPIKSELLDQEIRYKIISGIAKGLLYLHEDSRLRIIHRDLKSSNVLLDDKFIPKIADFGMARLVGMDETQGITCRVVGTYGYMSPEYAMCGKFSVKSDVFSFGVLILEITSGKRNNHFRNGDRVENLISYVWKNWCDGTAPKVIDPILRSNLNSTSEIMRCIHIGLLCVQENVAARPTMASVVFMLSSLSVELALPSEPAFLFGERVSAITNDPSPVSLNEMSMTEMDPR